MHNIKRLSDLGRFLSLVVLTIILNNCGQFIFPPEEIVYQSQKTLQNSSGESNPPQINDDGGSTPFFFLDSIV